MTTLESILKSKDITLPAKVYVVEAMVFPVVMYACKLDYKESWAPKNWCFWPVVLEKTLKSPLDCKEIKPINLKKIIPEYSMEGLMLKLKLQYFGHLMQRANSLEKTLMPGKIEGKRRRGQQRTRWWMASPTQWTWVSANSKRTGKPGVLQSMEVTKSWTQLSIWTTTKPQFKKKTQMRGCSLMKNINPKTGKGYQESD